MFAPFALLLISPFVQFTKGALVMDAVLLVAADVLMLRMIFHGVPYFGPRLAGAARTAVERRTESPLARAVVRAGAPDVYEQESTADAYPRTVDTPGRAMSQDRGVLFGAYGLAKHDRPGRLTTESASAKAARDTARTAQISAARAAARTAARPASPGGPAHVAAAGCQRGCFVPGTGPAAGAARQPVAHPGPGASRCTPR
ncbi:Type IV secretion system protein OS=Streptomyces parvulus OX=146923 GN=Spa2297_34210 PE=4 SV=1 [Streptomyces parvulus]